MYDFVFPAYDFVFPAFFWVIARFPVLTTRLNSIPCLFWAGEIA